jgi:hypothetical protein
LFICPDCFEVRGTTPEDWRSVCLCEGTCCNWCGYIGHRPISDYYDVDEGDWLHVPSTGFMGHTCKTPMNLRTHPRTSNLPAEPVQAFTWPPTRITWVDVKMSPRPWLRRLRLGRGVSPERKA